jgi:hypothetical protein
MLTALVTASRAESRRPGSLKVLELTSWPNMAFRYSCWRLTRSKSPPASPFRWPT